MEVVYYTVVAAGLYFFSNWVVDRIERAYGARLKYRSVLFFAIILTLSLLSFEMIRYFGQGS